MVDKPCLLLIRHAQSSNNAKAERERIPDPPITELGESQSRRLGAAVAKLAVERIYTSPFLRALQTTKHIAEATGIKPIVRQDIFEQGGCYRGYLDGEQFPEPGMCRKKISAFAPDWEIDERVTDRGWNTLDQYESLHESRIRASQVITWYESQPVHKTSRVALVIHADFKLRLLEQLLGHVDIEETFGNVVNTSITRVSKSGGRWLLDYWNAHQHLEREMITC